MLSIFLMVVLMAVGIILMKKKVVDNYLFETLVFALGIVITCTLIVGIINYMETNTLELEREEIILTMNEFTEGDITDSPILEEIVDFNTTLVWYRDIKSNVWFNFGISKKVNEVELIRK